MSPRCTSGTSYARKKILVPNVKQFASHLKIREDGKRRIYDGWAAQKAITAPQTNLPKKIIKTSRHGEGDIKRFIQNIEWKNLWHFGKKPLVITLIVLTIILAVIPPITYLTFVWDLGSKESIITKKSAGILLLDRNNQPFFSFYEARGKKNISFDMIPQYTKQAVIATEDKDFYKHPGLSARGIIRALLVDITKEEISQGGSTITQQLVKNTLLSQDRNLLRKYQEAVLALEVDRRFSKDDILEMYLNTVYFGEGSFGIENAAETYFDKPAMKLTLAESALLAGLLPAPSAYSPISGDKEMALRRQKLVLEQMKKLGIITQDQQLLAEQEKLQFAPQETGLNVTAPHFALMVKDELIKKYGEQKVARSGYVIQTTIDLKLQKSAEKIVKDQVGRLAQNNVGNGAAIVMNPRTGEILTLVGSNDWQDEKQGKINMVLSPRQPGSSFKPIVYAKAFDQRIVTPATIIEDKPVTFPDGYKPKNYDGKYHGNIPVRFALANSLNIPAVLVLERVGVRNAADMANRLGITTIKDPSIYGLSMVLGSVEVPLIELTGAYGAFANGGNKVTPSSILTVTDKRGNIIYKYQQQTNRVLDPAVAYLITDILSDNKARADTFGSALTISRTAAVKTGTTD
ncbi:MAG: transglycosylase domain-containing protein, partial [Candidatus Levybacteria bacterium]|nr:transglycosylase domain-containing protein [Candidatus Levybacteria bacterium]